MTGLLHSLLVLGLLWAGHWAGLKVMSQFRIMEHLLSPGGHTDLYVMAVAAAEAAVGLALVILLFRNRVTVNLDDLNLLKG